MDRLELRRITSYPGANASDIVILVGTFNIPTGLRAAEAALSNQPVCSPFSLSSPLLCEIFLFNGFRMKGAL